MAVCEPSEPREIEQPDPSERVFSVAGNVVTKIRNSLLSENVKALIFFDKNFNSL